MPSLLNWADDDDLVLVYARHLVHDHGASAEALLYFFEKPWKWPGDRLRKDAEGDDWCPECQDTEACGTCGQPFPEFELVNGPAVFTADGANDGFEWRKCTTCAGVA